MSTMSKVYRIDTDEEAIKRVHNTTIAEELAYEQIAPKPTRTPFTLSSIAPSDAEREIPPLRPQLPLPAAEYLHFDPELQADVTAVKKDYEALKKTAFTTLETVRDLEENLESASSVGFTEEVRKHFLLLVLDLHETVEELSAKHLNFISKQIHLDSEELEKLNLKKTEELKKYAEKVQNQETWSLFSTIAEYFSYAFSLITGAALMATGIGTLAGSFLIAAGGLGLANRVMSDTHAWQSIAAYFTQSQKMQEKISHWLSSSLFFVSVGLGLVGGIASWQCGGLRLIDAAVGTEKAIEKLGMAAGIATAGINVGKEWANKEMMSTRSALKLIEGKLFLMQQTLQEESSEAKKAIETMQALTKQTKECISAFG